MSEAEFAAISPERRLVLARHRQKLLGCLAQLVDADRTFAIGTGATTPQEESSESHRHPRENLRHTLIALEDALRGFRNKWSELGDGTGTEQPDTHQQTIEDVLKKVGEFLSELERARAAGQPVRRGTPRAPCAVPA